MKLKITHIKLALFFLFLGGSVSKIQAQNTSPEVSRYKIVRSSIGNGGSSKTIKTSKGNYKVSQSIGQSSVIGTHSSNGYYLRQGFQQPHKRIKIIKNTVANSLKALVYPNPFKESIAIQFNENLSNAVNVAIYDVTGKQVYAKIFKPSNRIELQLKDLASGSYLLKAISNGKLLNSKLIKL